MRVYLHMQITYRVSPEFGEVVRVDGKIVIRAVPQRIWYSYIIGKKGGGGYRDLPDSPCPQEIEQVKQEIQTYIKEKSQK